MTKLYGSVEEVEQNLFVLLVMRIFQVVKSSISNNNTLRNN